ncbi:MAG: hypothetical protein DYG89_10510 [Caldilinea sp. CFX5]|nr:hypothetical protein [Caldilinea sp. CFX5]
MRMAPSTVASSTQMVAEADAHRIADHYVTTTIDSMLTVASGTHYYHKSLRREIWQFIIRSGQAPLDAILIDAQTADVIPLTQDQVRAVRERAAIAQAKADGVLPIDEHGRILAEYARRKTNGYLSRKVSLFCSATDGVFIPLVRPIWQFAIRFGLPSRGELGILGTIDVGACTGEVIPLTNQQCEFVPMLLSNFRHRQQQYESDCLVACAEMVLTY